MVSSRTTPFQLGTKVFLRTISPARPDPSFYIVLHDDGVFCAVVNEYNTVYMVPSIEAYRRVVA